MGICFPKEKVPEETIVVEVDAPQKRPIGIMQPEGGSEEQKEGGEPSPQHAAAEEEKDESDLQQADAEVIPSEKITTMQQVAQTIKLAQPISDMDRLARDEEQRRLEEESQRQLDLQRRLDQVQVPTQRIIVKQSHLLDLTKKKWAQWQEQAKLKRSINAPPNLKFKKWSIEPKYLGEAIDKFMAADPGHNPLSAGGWYTGSVLTYRSEAPPHGPGSLLKHDCSMQFEGFWNEGKMVGDGHAIVFKKYPGVAEAEEGQLPSLISREVQLVFKTQDGNVLGIDENHQRLVLMPALEQFELEQQQIFKNIYPSSRRSSHIDTSHRETGQAEQRRAFGEEQAAADESQVSTNVHAAGGTGAMHEAEAAQAAAQKQPKYAEL